MINKEENKEIKNKKKISNENKKEFHSGFVAVVGETNVGKSTLINNVLQEKISIVTPKPQTTRTKILGIYTDKNMQIVFMDTPGLHKSKTKLSKVMNEEAVSVIKDSDLTIFIVDSREKEISEYNMKIIDELKKTKMKTILILNKVDLAKQDKVLEVIDRYSKSYDFAAIYPISIERLNSKNGKREDLLNDIYLNLPEGPKYYEEDEYTDQSIKDIVSEIIRSKVLKFVREEVPHGVFIEVNSFKKKKKIDKSTYFDIDATIHVERDSHKGIVIGKKGSMLKQIGTTSRADIERNLGEQVNLKLWVKVVDDWQNRDWYVDKFKK